MKTTVLLFLIVITFSYAQSIKQIVKQQQQEIDSLKAILLQMSTDTDGDGVFDFYDRCEETPVGARVDGVGCPFDTDLDGIIDLYDDCVTISGVAKLKGCPEVNPDYGCYSVEIPTIEFGLKDDQIERKQFSKLIKAIDIIAKYGKGMYFSINGHSVDYKSKKRNEKLAFKRAQAVYDYIVDLEPIIEYQLEIISAGDTDLLYPECEEPKECKKRGEEWKNRANNRVVFKVVEGTHTQ